jgi:hypothetical protein
MSLILNRLGTNFIARGLGNEEVDLKEQCEVITFDVNNQVIVNKENYPLTGIYGGESGWRWNKTKPQDLKDIRKRINHSIGGHISNLEEGALEKDWQGCVVSGIKLSRILEIQDQTKRKIWRPEINTGVYSIFNFDKRLYSNSSTCEILSVERLNESNGNYAYKIKNKCLDSTISINLFLRDSNYNNIPAFNYKYDRSLNEELSYYLNDNQEIEFKNLKTIKIGSESASSIEEIQCKLEHLGLGNRNRGICYTQYYPIVDVSLKTIKNEVVYTWQAVDSFKESSETDRHYIVDNETGKVLFNNIESEKLTIKEDFGFKIEVNEKIPERLRKTGKLKINNESLAYYDRSEYCFFLKPRESQYTEGTILEVLKTGKSLEAMEQIYISYTAKPRIDFECIPNKNFYSNLNVKPYTKVESNGIIQLNAQEKHVAKLTLTSDKGLIARNLYGPLFMQGDFSVLTAKAQSKKGKPVPETRVTFYGEEGNFEGDVEAQAGITKVTNKDGEAKTGFFYPFSNNALSQYSQLYHEGESSYLNVSNIGFGTNVNDIAIFQVYKTDSFHGSLGTSFLIKNKVNNFDSMILEIDGSLGLDYIEYEGAQQDRSQDIDGYLKRELDLCDANEWNTGMCLIKLSNSLGTVGPFKINKVFSKTKIEIMGARGPMRLVQRFDIENVTLYKRAELDWSGIGSSNATSLEEKLNSSLNKVVYTLNNESGLYEKVVPTRILNNRIYFDNLLLPKSDPNDRNNLIAAYKVMSSKDIKIHARCVDPASGYEIRSNEIKLNVDFPNYLKSTNGFRFKDEFSEESAGLGGANFIAINPDSYVSQLNLHIINE